VLGQICEFCKYCGGREKSTPLPMVDRILFATTVLL